MLSLASLALAIEIINDAFKFNSLYFLNCFIYLYFSLVLERHSEPKKVAFNKNFYYFSKKFF